MKGQLFKLGPLSSPEYDISKHASETGSHIFCECEGLVTLRFRHLGCHFMKQGYFEDLSVSMSCILFECRAEEIMS